MTFPIVDVMTAADGRRLRFGIRPASHPRGAVVLLPGRSEFLEKYAETAADLGARRLAVYALDWRGQGLSDRPLPDPQKGHIAAYEAHLADLEQFLAEVAGPAPAPRLILGHSMGAHIALRYMAERTDAAAGAVLTSPMVDIIPGPWPRPLARGLTAAAVARGWRERYAFGERPYRPKTGKRFGRNALTSDSRRYLGEAAMIAANPALALGGVTWGWLAATYASVDRLRDPAAAARIAAPVLMVAAGRDRVVSNAAQAAVCRRMPRCRRVVLPTARHEILMERDAIRSEFWALFDDWTGKILED